MGCLGGGRTRGIRGIRGIWSYPHVRVVIDGDSVRADPHVLHQQQVQSGRQGSQGSELSMPKMEEKEEEEYMKEIHFTDGITLSNLPIHYVFNYDTSAAVLNFFCIHSSLSK